MEGDEVVEEDPSPRRRRPPKPPPLQGVRAVMEHFKVARPFAVVSAKGFNPDTFEKEAKRHAVEYEHEKMPIAVGIQQITSAPSPATIVKLAPTFGENMHFMDPYSLHVFCCNDKRTAKELEKRGFRSVGATHLLGGPETLELPKLSIAVERNDEEIQVAIAPATVTLPRMARQPALWKPEGKTTAENIVHAFDIKVYDDDQNVVYSPYRLWTKEERKQFQTKMDSRFTKYCQIYYAVRRLLSDQQPKTIMTGMNDLIKLAKQDIARRKVSDPDWFLLATQIPSAAG